MLLGPLCVQAQGGEVPAVRQEPRLVQCRPIELTDGRAGGNPAGWNYSELTGAQPGVVARIVCACPSLRFQDVTFVLQTADILATCRRGAALCVPACPVRPK